jgi:hypothetical protein
MMTFYKAGDNCRRMRVPDLRLLDEQSRAVLGQNILQARLLKLPWNNAPLVSLL